MKPQTEKRVQQVRDILAKQYGADPAVILAGKSFAITGPQEERLLGAVQESSEFLTKINMPLVTDIQGEKVFSGMQQTITGRKASGRYRRNIDPTGAKYVCAVTDSGVIIPWHLADTWARMGDDFMAKYAAFVQRQISLDQLMIGWNGTSVAASSDPSAHKLLEDVNKGWMQWMRDNLAKNILTDGKTAGKIKVGTDATADYTSLDHLAYDLRQGLDPVHRQRTDLVLMVGADIIAKEADAAGKMHGRTPTERAAMKQMDLMGSFGGLPAVVPPQFPARGCVITTYDNLSIYTQTDSMRRAFKDDDELAGLVDSYYRNEAYVVEDETLFVGIEPANVVLEGDKGTTTNP
ncbi:phage major capsid protein, P2 family [Citrobacter portucalensis]|uniref:phage major capsid protein, P2 family n=1 Tax=Citrobacter portucalensis TaxID=1639133 RepID=UPI00226B465B|nr:phage major capsid protein, P2 family [Citrobacter portucalensis]MCX9039155.1 phage major capsid protein, P2 family [Citrobacter portucalensis]MCX9061117.1 phage major capsid protein, P2 family [Citrobacter portucalensis]